MDTDSILRIAPNLYIHFPKASLCTFDKTWKYKRLTPCQSKLLTYLAAHQGEYLAIDSIIRDVWEYDESIGNPSVQVRKAISQLRNKIKQLAPDVQAEQIVYTLKTHKKYSLQSPDFKKFDSLEEILHASSALTSPPSSEFSLSAGLDEEFSTAKQLEINGQFNRSFEIHYRLARQNYAPSLNYLGVLYCRGEYVEQNIPLGIDKYRQAAELQYSTALTNLGDYHMNRELGGYCPEEAVRLYHQAAEHPSQPDEDAMYRLYLCYHHGIGTEKNSAEAAKWQTLAQKKGVTKYVNYYMTGLTSLNTDPLVTGDTLLNYAAVSSLYYFLCIDTKERLPLDKSILLIGSKVSTCDLCLKKPVNSRHALLSRRSDCMLLMDLNSHTGTFINGKRISPLREYVLRDGDCIAFGTKEFIFLKND